MKAWLLVWLVALVMCGGGVSHASEPFDFSKLPCRWIFTSLNEIEEEATRKVDLRLVVERRVGSLTLRLPWLYQNLRVPNLNCPQLRVTDQMSIQFWMPDMRPLVPVLGVNDARKRVGPRYYRPVEPKRLEQNKAEYVVIARIKSFPSTMKEEARPNVTDADNVISNYQISNKLSFSPDTPVDLQIPGTGGGIATLYQEKNQRFGGKL